MRAVVYDHYGPSSVLEVRQVEDPRPGPGQVRVRVGGSSVNPIDWKVRSGYLAKVLPLTFPARTGRDAAGEVDEVGDGVDGVVAGDRVFGLTTGAGAAELAVTAVKAVDQLRLGGPSRLLVVGAGGAVGSIALQVAVARGHDVTGVASAGDKDFVEQHGARFVAAGPDLADRLGGSATPAFDAVLDATSSGALDGLAALVAQPSDVLAVAAQDAGDHGARAYDGRAGSDAEALAEIGDLLHRAALEIRVAATVPLSEIAQAQDRSAAGHVGGRIVVVP